jgi:Na+/H+ antiporter NhaD/arsenite permease-like protein
LDWKTTLFLFALFLLVAALVQEGWIDSLAKWIVNTLSSNKLTIFLFIIALSVITSAFVDNVPYLIAMMPLVNSISGALDSNFPLFMFALFIGTSLGGNITPIGASANIAAVGFLEKHGYKITFGQWIPIGLKFTAFALIPACIGLWMVWS